MWFNPFVFVLGLMALIFSIPLMAIWTEHRRRVLEMQGEGILRRADSPIMRALLKYADVGFEVLGKKALNECCRLTVEGQA